MRFYYIEFKVLVFFSLKGVNSLYAFIIIIIKYLQCFVEFRFKRVLNNTAVLKIGFYLFLCADSFFENKLHF